MKHILAPAIIAFLLVTASVAQAQTTVTKSLVSYQIKNLGINTEGKFTGLEADIKFDPAQLATSSIEASIDVNTVNSDNDTRDEHLKGEKFFDAAHYPKITLKSTSFKSKGGNKYIGKFNVTIKGVTKPVDVPFTYAEANGKGTYNGTFQIKRLDFKVGGSSLTLADDAFITVSAEVNK